MKRTAKEKKYDHDLLQVVIATVVALVALASAPLIFVL